MNLGFLGSGYLSGKLAPLGHPTTCVSWSSLNLFCYLKVKNFIGSELCVPSGCED